MQYTAVLSTPLTKVINISSGLYITEFMVMTLTINMPKVLTFQIPVPFIAISQSGLDLTIKSFTVFGEKDANVVSLTIPETTINIFFPPTNINITGKIYTTDMKIGVITITQPTYQFDINTMTVKPSIANGDIVFS